MVVPRLSILRVLDLSFSRIASLPVSIGNLKGLKELNLYTEYLSELPDEIRNLGNLRKLDIRGSGIISLPASIRNLKDLEALHFSYTKYLPKYLSNLPDEIGNLGSLRKLDLNSKFDYNSLPPSIKNKLGLSLACERARSRTGFEMVDDKKIIPNLWPLVLSNATLFLG